MNSVQMSQLATYPTTAISDALDSLGIDGGCKGLYQVTPGVSCAGIAFTVQFKLVDPDEKGLAADYIDNVPTGAVIVLNNDGRTDCTVWGDILTIFAQERGIAGTIINGCCRDIASIRNFNYPVFALGTYMKSGKNRVRMVAQEVPVVIGNTTVRPGDLLVGDDDGVVSVPRESLDEVADITAKVVAMEREVIDAVRKGITLAEARLIYGYHGYSWRKKQ